MLLITYLLIGVVVTVHEIRSNSREWNKEPDASVRALAAVTMVLVWPTHILWYGGQYLMDLCNLIKRKLKK